MVYKISRKLFNDFHLGLSFTVLGASSNSMSHIQEMFQKSIHHVDPLYNVDGYVTLGMYYLFASLSMFIGPSLISIIGCKSTLVIGAVTNSYFVLYYFESNWLSYFGAILHGIGGGFLWLSQATYMILNSEMKSTTQSVGIFSAFNHASSFIGSAVIYFLFKENDDPYLSQSMRQEIIIIFACIVACAVLMLSLLRDPIRQNQIDELRLTPLGEIKSVYKIMTSGDALFHNIIYIFCGFNVSFLSVMASSLGFTEYLSNNSKIYTPLSGAIQGVGEIVGVTFTACLGRKSILKLRAIPLACIATMITYLMVFLALPRSSAFTYTDEKPMIEFSIYVLMVGNGLIGFGDACLQTGMYNYIGYTHPHNCAPALAHLKSVRNLATAVSFYFCNYYNLQIQTAILMLFSTLAFCTFYGKWNKTYSEDEEVSSQNSEEKILNRY